MNQASWYQQLFAFVYDPVMRSTEQRKLSSIRKHLLEDLHGNILEVGVGTGANLPYYPSEIELTLLEPNPAMLNKVSHSLDRFNTLKILPHGITEVEKLIPAHSFDAIVSTLVLCSVPDVEKSLGLFSRWLKPEGKLLVIEHIRSSKKFSAKIEDWLTPAWKHLAQGCHLNRATDKLIREAGFLPIREAYFDLGVQGYWGIFKLSST